MTQSAAPKFPSAKSLRTYFEYLDALRKSGVTNMFGAPVYLMESFRMPREKAVKVTGAWMKTFSQEKSMAERVATAIETRTP